MLLNKINMRLDELQELLDNQIHLKDPECVSDCIDSISKFWSVLEEDQKDYIQCATYAVEKQIEWK